MISESLRGDKAKRLFEVLDMCKLNPRDEEIVMNIEEFFDNRGYLTKKQQEVLMDIYERSDSGKA